MGISTALGLWRFTPVDNPGTFTGHESDFVNILIILGVLLVILLIGIGVSFARRPDRQIDEFGEPTGAPPR
ncbi:hypothetical protein AB4Z18_12780 [Leifsonia sp. 2TAF2]|uniref:hypothetical protein n=1 Tax=Leifsonia sp. 2TAF2 TaxID=3233009 RepID=UPI003F9B2152